ncbi:MAG: hypothetical protein ACYC4K_01205 [Thiobacillus sp.]
MKFILVVIHPFTFGGVDYAKGAEIADAKTIKSVLDSEMARSCNKVSA